MNSTRIAMALAAMGIGVCGAAEAQVNQQDGMQATANASTSPSGFYGGIGYATIFVDDGFGDTAVLGAIQGKIGYALTPNLAVEGEAAFGVLAQEYDFGGTTVELNLDREWGIFAVGRAPVSPNVALFARAGYVSAQISADAGGVSASSDDTGFAFGAGLDWTNVSTTLRVELTQYSFDEGDDALAFGTSVLFGF